VPSQQSAILARQFSIKHRHLLCGAPFLLFLDGPHRRCIHRNPERFERQLELQIRGRLVRGRTVAENRIAQTHMHIGRNRLRPPDEFEGPGVGQNVIGLQSALRDLPPGVLTEVSGAPWPMQVATRAVSWGKESRHDPPSPRGGSATHVIRIPPNDIAAGQRVCLQHDPENIIRLFRPCFRSFPSLQTFLDGAILVQKTNMCTFQTMLKSLLCFVQNRFVDELARPVGRRDVQSFHSHCLALQHSWFQSVNDHRHLGPLAAGEQAGGQKKEHQKDKKHRSHGSSEVVLRRCKLFRAWKRCGMLQSSR
jgi:hypothetical protein